MMISVTHLHHSVLFRISFIFLRDVKTHYMTTCCQNICFHTGYVSSHNKHITVNRVENDDTLWSIFDDVGKV